jgi:hypothetical protein
MRELFPKSDARVIGAIMAMVLLVGSIPFDAGVIITSSSRRVELSADICRPLQSADRVSNGLLARPAISVPAFFLPQSGWASPPIAIHPIDYRVAPDTPPPKFL